MSGRAGWPAHRPRCRAADDESIDVLRRQVGGSLWLVRICAACGSVAMEPTAAKSAGGDAA